MLLWLSLTSARKKIQSKMKALEWSQDYPSILKKLKGSLNSMIGDGIWPKFKVISSFYAIWLSLLLERMKMLYHLSHHNISPIISLWEFFQMLKGS